MLETSRSTKAQRWNQEVKAGTWVWAPVMRTLVAEAILGLDTGLFIYFLCGQEPRLTILGHGRRCSECNRLRQTEEVEGEMTLAAGVFFHLHSAASPRGLRILTLNTTLGTMALPPHFSLESHICSVLP